MTSWGLGPWGFTEWGGASPPVPGNNPPIIVSRNPLPNAVDVLENAVVSVAFFDIDLDLDTATTLIEIDGATAYSGAGGFTAGYAGRVYYSAGTYTVQIVKLEGWGFDTEVTVRGRIEDSMSNFVDDTWRWRTRENPICYTGLNPLPIEIAIQSPMTRFLELESPRRIFLANALQTQEKAIHNRDNKAARVLYQQGFATEISVLQNPAAIRNEAALQTVVCERNRVTALDEALRKVEDRTRNGIQSLFNLGALPKEYIPQFNDYLDSTLYNYRVSLIANLILLARSIETAND